MGKIILFFFAIGTRILTSIYMIFFFIQTFSIIYQALIYTQWKRIIILFLQGRAGSFYRPYSLSIGYR